MITHVAIMRDGQVYALPSPNRHHSVFYIMPLTKNEEGDVHGFLDDQDNFLTRSEAYVIATDTGQINRRVGSGLYNGRLLFSEDLW